LRATPSFSYKPDRMDNFPGRYQVSVKKEARYSI